MHVQEERKGALGPGKGLMVGLAGQTPRGPGSEAPVVSFRGWSPSRAGPHLPLPVIPGACPSVWPRDGPGSLCLGRKELLSLKERISLQPWNVPGVGRTLRREGQPGHPPAPRHWKVPWPVHVVAVRAKQHFPPMGNKGRASVPSSPSPAGPARQGPGASRCARPSGLPHGPVWQYCPRHLCHLLSLGPGTPHCLPGLV